MQPAIRGPEKAWSDRKEAALWLGLTEGEFESELKRFPHLLPSQRIGRSDKWASLDLAVYLYLRSAGRCGSPAEVPDEPAPEKK